MAKLPRVTAAQAIAALEGRGFVCVRQSGSHKIFKNAGGVRVTIPFHASKILHPKIVKDILKDAHMRPEDLK
ncbi:hypothetical protein A2853_00420 [Candidatus Kaiserbacteria bacterium RIFCSPHIGHO2_01_FULL_55_17]|uniref:Addiction module toxin, HicA family n=1 Tax=Candidatus Kaiserbacteria bacterium RIFCSPHIGHO2_01_FULL_55_17 TaxID=1798484 RepID=A0A1F6D860_9BACT|nr:MAG: hypothetical protein A2853_00420 [Candidatus Kaiserbacteria bacterium RIFCSPHIGHO2_01_FULL_55_17]